MSSCCSWCGEEWEKPTGKVGGQAIFCSKLCARVAGYKRSRWGKGWTLAKELNRQAKLPEKRIQPGAATGSIEKMISVGDQEFLKKMGWTRDEAKAKLHAYRGKFHQDAHSMEWWHHEATKGEGERLDGNR